MYSSIYCIYFFHILVPCPSLYCQGASQYQTSALCTTSREASHADGMAWASRAKLVLVGGDAASCRAAATHETWVCDVGDMHCTPLNITRFEKYPFATLLTWQSRFLLAPSRYKKFPSKVSFVFLFGNLDAHRWTDPNFPRNLPPLETPRPGLSRSSSRSSLRSVSVSSVGSRRTRSGPVSGVRQRQRSSSARSVAGHEVVEDRGWTRVCLFRMMCGMSELFLAMLKYLNNDNNAWCFSWFVMLLLVATRL